MKHYDEGKNIPFEEKLFDIVRYPRLTIYYIEFKKDRSFYNFYNSEKCVDDFLGNVKHRSKSTNKKWFKCSFNIENTLSATEQFVEDKFAGDEINEIKKLSIRQKLKAHSLQLIEMFRNFI